jgi:hypothetical protein
MMMALVLGSMNRKSYKEIFRYMKSRKSCKRIYLVVGFSNYSPGNITSFNTNSAKRIRGVEKYIGGVVCCAENQRTLMRRIPSIIGLQLPLFSSNQVVWSIHPWD